MITNEAGTVIERLGYDAQFVFAPAAQVGKRRYANGTDDAAGAIESETTRGFTGHEELDGVGLVHMNGRIYDPILARFTSADPVTEAPFSTQGWNRYSYVGNSPLNFADPSGYCFMGCFWKSAVHAIRQALTNIPILRTAIQIAVSALATAVCGPCATAVAVASGLTSAAITGLTGGSFSASLRSGLISVTTALAFNAVGTDTLGPDHATPSLLSDAHIANIAGHAAVGCLSSVASGGKCGQGAASAAAGSFGAPLIVTAFSNFKTDPAQFVAGAAVSATLGGLASVAAGGKFATGAETAAFGYLFNQMAHDEKGNPWAVMPPLSVTPETYRLLGYNLIDGIPVGSALKEDFDHYAPTFFRAETAVNGALFFIQPSGPAGQFSSLWQYEVPGGLRGQPGIVEYILNPWWSNTLTHQRFIAGGTITGFPNQRPRYLPGPKN